MSAWRDWDDISKRLIQFQSLLQARHIAYSFRNNKNFYKFKKQKSRSLIKQEQKLGCFCCPPILVLPTSLSLPPAIFQSGSKPATTKVSLICTHRHKSMWIYSTHTRILTPENLDDFAFYFVCSRNDDKWSCWYCSTNVYSNNNNNSQDEVSLEKQIMWIQLLAQHGCATKEQEETSKAESSTFGLHMNWPATFCDGQVRYCYEEGWCASVLLFLLCEAMQSIHTCRPSLTRSSTLSLTTSCTFLVIPFQYLLHSHAKRKRKRCHKNRGWRKVFQHGLSIAPWRHQHNTHSLSRAQPRNVKFSLKPTSTRDSMHWAWLRIVRYNEPSHDVEQYLFRWVLDTWKHSKWKPDSLCMDERHDQTTNRYFPDGIFKIKWRKFPPNV